MSIRGKTQFAAPRFGRLDADLAEVQSAIVRSREYLLSEQHPDGYWCGDTNDADLWLQPQRLTVNPVAGDLQNDGTNWYVAKTNWNNLFAISQLITEDDLTNGKASFTGNGSGLTNLNLGSLNGLAPTSVTQFTNSLSITNNGNVYHVPVF